MNEIPKSGPWRLDPWIFDPELGRLARPGDERRLEPKVADLLALLIERAGSVVPRQVILETLWPDVVVGDDALGRCVSKLRKALDDDPKDPRFVETVPKRGYRLLAVPESAAEESAEPELAPSIARDADGAAGEVAGEEAGGGGWPSWAVALGALVAVLAVGVVGLLVSVGDRRGAAESTSDGASRASFMAERADDFYHQVNRSDNESAIELYERALGVDPDFAPAHSGLANALVQRVLRYPAEEVAPLDEVNLGNALASGRLATAEARRHLERALGLAERSVRLAPRNAPSHKALGFVYSALGRPDEAMAAYERALELDPNAWDVWINKGELHEIAGDDEAALLAFEQAFEAMGRVYEEQSSRVRPWHGELGTLIGGRHEGAGRAEAAEVWYRRVLSTAPLHPSATCALARLLRRAGDEAAAERLVRERRERTAEVLDCAEILRDLPAD